MKLPSTANALLALCTSQGELKLGVQIERM
jgi:hypothetical protein